MVRDLRYCVLSSSTIREAHNCSLITALQVRGVRIDIMKYLSITILVRQASGSVHVQHRP